MLPPKVERSLQRTWDAYRVRAEAMALAHAARLRWNEDGLVAFCSTDCMEEERSERERVRGELGSILWHYLAGPD
ncbi:MAG: hypothetical protein HY329_17185 [Chloroflexi bacterium]|nr:hypothetical protein [Chloroflexota bacterium]